VRGLLEARVLAGFDDPALTADAWRRALGRGPTDVVFLTPEYQRAWWRVFGRGELLLVAVECEGEVVALAPLFADGGMAFLVGSGGSDVLDLIGDTSDPVVLDALLESARAAVPDFVGFLFYHVPDGSPTGARLAASAERLGLRCVDQGELPAPYLDLRPPGALAAARDRQSLRRHDAWLRRHMGLEVEHASRAEAILPRLPDFFDQHVRRWAGSGHPSLFTDPAQRRFYAEIARGADAAGWLRFTELRAGGRPAAFHFGFSYRGRYLWYKPSFEIELARRSPGEALLRALLGAAGDEGAAVFDFGLGDEPFKARFATGVATVRTWGLYP
jgi:CelD/BcsL family acetyltransferase involved in cellulose biosynthesis